MRLQKVVCRKDGDHEEQGKKIEKKSLVCISFRRMQGREIQK